MRFKTLRSVSPPLRGGVAARSADGVVTLKEAFPNSSHSFNVTFGVTTPSVRAEVAIASFFFAAQPPLLTQEGTRMPVRFACLLGVLLLSACRQQMADQ